GGGHKGALRYVTDYKLRGFHGYAVMAAGQEPALILPFGNAGGERSSWISDHRFARSMPDALIDGLKSLKNRERIGIVGLAQAMRVDEYQIVTKAFPETEFIDATAIFDRVRGVKSAEELRGLEEAAYIADQCLKRLIEIARPGVSKRSIEADMY